MKRFFFLAFIALVTVFIVLIAKRPDILENFKLWMLGLIAPVAAFFQSLWKRGGTYLSKMEDKLFPPKSQ